MWKIEHKCCQWLVGSFVNPSLLAPSKSPKVRKFWTQEIKFAQDILREEPDMRFWRFLYHQRQKDKYLNSLLWFKGEKGKKFLKERKSKDFRTFLFDFPQPKSYLLTECKIGDDKDSSPESEKRWSVLNFLRKKHGKKT